MHARALFSLFLAFALMVAPLSSCPQMFAFADVPNEGVHQAAASADDHCVQAEHEGDAKAKADTHSSGCIDHQQCQGNCTAHCLSLPVASIAGTFVTESIHVRHVTALGPTFIPDTPSRPPQTAL